MAGAGGDEEIIMKDQDIDDYDIIKWAESALNSKVSDAQKLKKTNYSNVIKLTVDKNEYFLKQTPKTLFIEAESLSLIRRNLEIMNVPEVIAQNEELNCFLLSSCGDETLRDYFQGEFDIDIFIKGLEIYKSIQKKSQKFLNQFEKLGIPNWQLKRLLKEFDNFTSAKDQLKNWNISDDTILDFKNTKTKFIECCKCLEQKNIRPVLNHSDFHDNNMVIIHKTQEVFVIDWSETNISHPFLSLECCFYNIRNRYHIKSDSIEYEKLKSAFFSSWSLEMNAIQEIERFIQPLASFYYILTYKDLGKRTGYAFPKLASKIKNALKVYLSQNKNI